MVILVGLAIDQIAQSGLSSLSVIYYSAQLFSLFMLVPFSNHSWSNDRIRERAFSSFWELNSYPKLRLIIVDRWVD
ncbi:hypothetical protein APX81_22945 [Escherichia coli]|nr:hypothetical protein [Escherichia coli]OZM99793.1 hypothetical protein CF018_25210 [Escherichia coli]PAZ26935.1 hypothetical protein APU33_03950 [Escherichia coli]PAZ32052.1 hypothetical protein APU34_03710 [Escherichia coli]PAZ36179.1 hypothetical protein APU36_22285 [Escherichia coli]